MKRLTALALSSALLLGTAMPASAANLAQQAGGGTTPITPAASVATFFSDVTAENINAEAVSYLKGKGIVQGYADGSFGVNKDINRAEFLKILLLAAGSYTEDAGKTCVSSNPASFKKYKDVVHDSWYAPYVCYAIQNNIMEGYPDGTMRPESAINVPEMAKLVSVVMKLQLGGAGNNWYDKYMKALESKNALPSTLKQLSENISRGEMAEVIFRTKEGRTDKAAVTTAELQGQKPARLASGTVGQISSCSELSNVMETQLTAEAAQRQYDYTSAMPVNAPNANGSMGGDVGAAMPSKDANGGGGADYSSTNVQVEGVDEGDIVKNDARYIYTVRQNQVRIVDTKDGAEGLKELSAVKIADENFWPSEMYVDGDRLTIIGSSYEDIQYRTLDQKISGIMPPYYYGRSLAKTILVNIADRSAPKIDRVVSLEGTISQSRRIAGKLYLILNDYPKYWLMREQFAPVEKILPTITDTARGISERPAVNCNEVQYFPGYQQPNYMTVAVIPTSDNSKDVEAKVFLGNAESIYMSLANLYVTTGATSPDQPYWSWNDTQLYKFKLTDTGVEQTASGKVKGRVLDQFSMDEHNGNLRIATHRDNWVEGTNSSENAVYVLDSALKVIGSALNIAPGERLYSTRFMGDRGYMVTFQNIDPFFVIDLATPTAPKVLGALKIPGWSTYLHPYDATHVIGFGQNVEVKTDTGSTMSGATMPVTWQNVQGMKMSMFDVSDVNNPKEQFSTTLGAQGTYSELLYNHKALLFDKDRNLLAFPVSITEGNGVKIYKECSLDAAGKENCTETGRYDDYKTTFEGAIVYTVDLVNGFKERGRVSHYDKGYYDYSATNLPENEYLKAISRVVFMNNSLYSVSQAMIKQGDLNTVQTTDSVTLAN